MRNPPENPADNANVIIKNSDVFCVSGVIRMSHTRAPGLKIRQRKSANLLAVCVHD
jgi:hypothetical protein